MITMQACPECEAQVQISQSARLNEIIDCASCRSELEIVALSPAVLALAPEVEEDWGADKPPPDAATTNEEPAQDTNRCWSTKNSSAHVSEWSTRMTTAGATHKVAIAAIKDLSESGTHLVQHKDFSSLTGAPPGDWARFAQHWNDLKLDTFMADGGTYRYRRYSQFEIDVETECLTRLPHGPYRQEADVNKLNGGIDRLYEPLTETFVDDPVLRGVLMELAGIFTGVDGTKKWNVKVTPIRIVATQDEVGQPTPEGRHSDGATFITSLMIGRSNVTGGESSVYTEDGDCLVTTTLSEPGDILLSDDRRTLHGVTALRPEENVEQGHRDVLIIAYTSL